MKILVTGATGCVGRATVAAARAAGHEVVGVARRPAAVDARLVLARVEDGDAMKAAAEGCAAVIHLASWVHQLPDGAGERAALRASIVEGTRNVARAARAAGARLMVASTVAAIAADTPYGRAKREAEDEAGDALILRIVHVYGPHDRGNMAALARALRARRAFIVGDGENRKSMVYAGNLADRIVLACQRPAVTGTHVAADGAHTQREIIGELAAALGRRPPPSLPRAPLLAVARVVDRVAGTSYADRVEKLAAATVFDGRPLDDLLGYRPRISFPDGIRLAVAGLDRD